MSQALQLHQESLNGGSQMVLKATLCNLCTSVYKCAHLWPLGPLHRGNSRRKMMTIVGTRKQLWKSTSNPHLLSPHLDCPDFRSWVSSLQKGPMHKGPLNKSKVNLPFDF